MDIHKEHTAFLEFYVKEHTTAYDEVDTFYKGVTFVDPHVQHGFTIWIAAKQHAVEMAKPVVQLHETMGDKWGLYLPSHHRALEVKDNREQAEAWAKENGYRVVEE